MQNKNKERPDTRVVLDETTIYEVDMNCCREMEKERERKKTETKTKKFSYH